MMVEREILTQFRAISIFAPLSDEQLLTVVQRSNIRRFEKSQEVLSSSDATTDVFFVLDGSIQVKNFSTNGREVIHTEISRGGLCGEFSAIDGLPRSAWVVAQEPSVIARMRSADFMELLRGNFEISLQLMQLLVSKARRLSNRVLELVVLSSHDRVRAELLRLAQDSVQVSGHVVIRPAPTHYEIAARVGSHREAVTKELNRLEALGYIRLKRKQITILDLERFRSDLLPAL